MIPLIGITTSFNGKQSGLDHAYAHAIQIAQGQTLPLPLVCSAGESDRLCNLIHGLIIPGGPGITVGTEGSLPAKLNEVHPKRWESDNLILDAAIERNLPILGICYGMQLLCVRAGGSLYADVEKQVVGTSAHSEHRGAYDHSIDIVSGSFLEQVWNSGRDTVNTRHFQAVCDPGQNYRVSARSSDGTIEAIERTDGIHIGVQFHPERMKSFALFCHLVRQAREYAHAS